MTILGPLREPLESQAQQFNIICWYKQALILPLDICLTLLAPIQEVALVKMVCHGYLLFLFLYVFSHMYIKRLYLKSFFIGYGPHITVINHDETTPTQRSGVCSSTGALGTTPPASGSLGPPGLSGVLGAGRGIITGAPSPHQLSRQGSSVESHASSVPIHYHTPECSATGRSLHQPTHHSKVRLVL